MILKRTLLSFTSALLIISMLFASSASALSGSAFTANRIIDDSLFFDKSSMSASQIQAFLNSKVPTCDTNHTRSSSPNDPGPPYTCLKTYSQNTPAKSAESELCGALSTKANRSSANMIYDIAQACGISPKVLIVLLQKEQSLVTDTWPWPVQYQKATGYGCPDTAPCDSQYYGFFNQVYMAARQFKKYAKTPDNYNYQQGFTSYVQYHPNTSCGGSDVTMQNQATADLYNYTPYQPNAAALNNLYGTGNSCSSYGNRNFWRLYNDWFGRTLVGCTSSDPAEKYVYRSYRPADYTHFFTVRSCERDAITYRNAYTYEGVAFYQAQTGQPNLIPVYRVYDSRSGYHFWTKSLSEKNNLVNKHGWTAEGTGFNAYSIGGVNRKPVYRLYNPAVRVHLYTSASSEIGTAKKVGYNYEGVAFYASASY